MNSIKISKFEHVVDIEFWKDNVKVGHWPAKDADIIGKLVIDWIFNDKRPN